MKETPPSRCSALRKDRGLSFVSFSHFEVFKLEAPGSGRPFWR